MIRPGDADNQLQPQPPGGAQQFIIRRVIQSNRVKAQRSDVFEIKAQTFGLRPRLAAGVRTERTVTDAAQKDLGTALAQELSRNTQPSDL